MGVESKLVFQIILPIVILFIILLAIFGPGLLTDALGTAKSGVDWFINDIEVGSGLDELQATEVGLSQNHQDEYEYLISTMNFMLNEKNGANCFRYFGGFSTFEEETQLIMTQDGENVEMIMFGGEGGKQIYDTVTIENMQLCVIGGSEEVVSNFYENFLDNSEDNVFNLNDHMEVNQIRIAFEDNINRNNENRIDYGDGLHDFEGDDWLFTPDNKHICFFPTKYEPSIFNCDASSSIGLDESCLTDNEDEHSIPYGIIHEKLVGCGD